MNLDNDLTDLLRTLYLPPEDRTKYHPKFYLWYSKERFGVREHKVKENRKCGPSRRQRKCVNLREEIHVLKKLLLKP